MLRRYGSSRMMVLAVSGMVACTVVSGCADDDSDGSAKDGKSEDAKQQSPDSGQRDTGAVRAAYDKTAQGGTAKIALNTTTRAKGETVTAKGDGVIDLKDGDSTLTLTVPGGKVEQRVIDGVLFQKPPKGQESGLPKGKTWIKIDLAKAAKQNGGAEQASDPASSAAFAKAVSDKQVKKLGSERVGGTDTTRYRVRIDVDKMAAGDDSMAKELKQQLGSSIPMELWLDDEGRMRRQQIETEVKVPKEGSEGAAGKAAVKTVIEYRDFGTEVNVEAPPAGQTADMMEQAPQ